MSNIPAVYGYYGCFNANGGVKKKKKKNEREQERDWKQKLERQTTASLMETHARVLES